MYLVPPWGSGQLLLHRFHHGDAVVVKQVQVFVAYNFEVYSLHYLYEPHLPTVLSELYYGYQNWTAATNLQQGTRLRVKTSPTSSSEVTCYLKLLEKCWVISIWVVP